MRWRTPEVCGTIKCATIHTIVGCRAQQKSNAELASNLRKGVWIQIFGYLDNQVPPGAKVLSVKHLHTEIHVDVLNITNVETNE